MRVVLARRRIDGSPLSRPPEVHIYRVPDSPDGTTENAPARRGAEWVSVCGDMVKPGEVESIESFTGAQCMECYTAAGMASDVAPLTREELEAPPVHELGGIPREIAAGPSSGELFSMSWRERMLHRVAVDAPRTRIDGRPLVIGLCGALGWEPQRVTPHDWPMCSGCDQIAGVRT